jgi:hypothetical protein
VACIQPDGTLSPSGELILLALYRPGGAEDAARESGVELFLVRAGIREFLQAGLLESVGDKFQLTDKGVKALEGKLP